MTVVNVDHNYVAMQVVNDVAGMRRLAEYLI